MWVCFNQLKRQRHQRTWECCARFAVDSVDMGSWWTMQNAVSPVVDWDVLLVWQWPWMDYWTDLPGTDLGAQRGGLHLQNVPEEKHTNHKDTQNDHKRYKMTTKRRKVTRKVGGLLTTCLWAHCLIIRPWQWHTLHCICSPWMKSL